jgi:hypothetical protein
MQCAALTQRHTNVLPTDCHSRGDNLVQDHLCHLGIDIGHALVIKDRIALVIGIDFILVSRPSALC